ncbi:6040_t:CDS:2 [Racocetra fulgida]|uniref:6040_t:CDS:1 n=1 Tax=Racocetra fulgida TaxID=60492 RepID=A0A9N9BZU2_9GLOM|nr:6040_t:CDS:2 [Racocetra fulgida]
MYDSVKSIKDSVAYCKKDYNKCDKHNRKLVDRNDPRYKIKGAGLETVDPENPENKILLKYFNSLYEEVLINEFKDQIKYLELLNLLDPKDYSVQIKGHENENFCSKVIRFSANTNVRFIYDFCKDEKLKPISEQKFNNTKLFEKTRKILEKKYGRFEELDN